MQPTLMRKRSDLVLVVGDVKRLMQRSASGTTLTANGRQSTSALPRKAASRPGSEERLPQAPFGDLQDVPLN